MSKKLGKNPIVLNSALNVYYGLLNKLTNYEKMELEELDNIENMKISNKSNFLGGEIKKYVKQFNFYK